MPNSNTRKDFILTENFAANDIPTKRTYVICGMPRGGTTMVAGVSKMLGLDIGADLLRNLEDNNFNWDFLEGNTDEKIHCIKQQIKHRNGSRDVWGWKFPNATNYLSDVLDDIVNPHLVVVFRDFPAQSYRSMKTRPMSFDQLLKIYITRLNKLMRLFQNTDCPKILLSYEKCTAQSDIFIDEMVKFLGADAPDAEKRAKIREFMQPESYKSLESYL